MAVTRQDAETVITELEGTRCEQLLAVPGADPDTALFLYMKAGGTWYRFYLDAGLLFWDESTGPAPEDDLAPSEAYQDLTSRLGLHPVLKELRKTGDALVVKLENGVIFSLHDSKGQSHIVFQK